MNEHAVNPEELQAWLDGELADDRTAQVEDHLRECADCSTIVEELKTLSARLKEWSIETPPDSLAAPVVISDDRAMSWLFRRPAMFIAGVAAVLMIVASVSMPNLYSIRRPTGAAVSGIPTGREFKQSRKSRPSESDSNELLDFFELEGAAPESPPGGTDTAAERMIARTASLTIEVDDFEMARLRIQSIVGEVNGFIAHQSLTAQTGQRQQGWFSLRVPSDSLPQSVEKLHSLGRVTHEEIGAEEVTDQVVDLEARLKNARVTERRLIDILNQRTGKLSQILEVEREIARKRGEIERMVAQRDHLLNRVSLANIEVSLFEEFAERETVRPGGIITRMKNAARDGFYSFFGLLNALLLFVLRWFLHLALLGLLGWQIWRRWLGPGIREQFGDSL